ncbi:MAG: ribonuclease III [Candidatus Magasanikbacteria bacterium RIFCSPHIGHO2_01_FULL_50_8]|uniref:Ribonuclease 3 n=1 Tax=Candidatus Magasanikbacteria bacterium RIFCSPHIGHO2_01_FULL_50_8 TaxID=1798674 RepID=A0A1F6LR89_9BACT|nr:MAG: ribonuclease III [Candidatus Magasanikbacteria bacterium RIFCSPHIGHO2_01_FULL_50_8]
MKLNSDVAPLDPAGLERRIGVKFTDKQLLMDALTHRSYLNDTTSAYAVCNERLEFLGDAVLDVVIKHHLFRTMPTHTEGRMTQLYGALVNNRALATIGEQLEVEHYMRFARGSGFELRKEKSVHYMRACAIEAIIGALRIDRGMGVAELFIHRFILPRLEEIKHSNVQDPKSLLQELVQSDLQITPRYEQLESHGPAHDRVYTVGLFLGLLQVSTGTGQSIQIAEMGAAAVALKERYGMEARN